MTFDNKFTGYGRTYNPLYVYDYALYIGYYPNEKIAVEFINEVRKFSRISKQGNIDIHDRTSTIVKSIHDSSRYKNSIEKQSNLSKYCKISSFETTEFLTDPNGGYYDSSMNDHAIIPTLDGSRYRRRKD